MPTPGNVKIFPDEETVLVTSKGSIERCIYSYVLSELHREESIGHLLVFHQR